jgi:hypothetical protein
MHLSDYVIIAVIYVALSTVAGGLTYLVMSVGQ